jgi:hypothetical protein
VKARSFGQRKMLIGHAEHAGRAARSIAGFCALILLVALAVEFLPFLRWKALLIGFMIGSACTFVIMIVMRVGDPLVHGQWAEQWSHESLRKVDGWLVSENLPFDGVDVDHVVVTPQAVLAVETKFRGRGSSEKLNAARHANQLSDARAAARKVESFLRSRRLHTAVEVVPILMVWGPGKHHVADGAQQESGVWVVDAEDSRLWSHLFAAPLLTLPVRREVHRCLTDYIAVRHGYDGQKLPPIRREMITAFRAGLRYESEQRSARRKLHRSRSKRHAAT